jgi:aminoacyl tRNA synthase complex-interacting multifunctional protein 1
MKVTSNAALGTLTVSTATLASDPLLKWIVQIASSKQLTVKEAKKATLGLELISGLVLSQRNAIIRCLCGMGLHNALDGAPYYLLGGHSMSVGSSAQHSMAMASITSWMSTAEHAKNNQTAAADYSLLPQLEAHLTTRAFLVPSFQCTIADVDVALVLLSSNNCKDQIASFPNVHRWILSVTATLTEQGIQVPSVDPIANSHAAPLFFYGTEDVALPKPVQAAAPKKEAAAPQQAQQKQQQGKKEKPKKDKQPQQQQQQEPVSFDISALDMRVGKIVKVWPHPEAEKLFCEEIDVGEDAPRQIASGLRPFYKTEELENRRVIVLCNLKKRNLVGFPSHGMVMCAANDDHSAVEYMEPPADAKIGERVLFEGYQGDPEPENKIAKKKVFEGVAPDLKTNAQGICVWKGAVSQTTAGPIKASKGMPNAHVA